MNSSVQNIIKGAVDFHVHASPSIKEEQMDVLEVARAAYEFELGGFVYKSEDHPTAALASILKQMYPGLKIIGSLVLNDSIGGINPSAIEISARLGAKVVWIPPLKPRLYPEKQCVLFTNDGSLSKESLNALEIIGSHEMTLVSCLTSLPETITLFNEAKRRGVKRMVANNAHGTMSIEDQREIASHGAYLEYTFLSCMPSHAKINPKKMTRDIQSVGIDKCIVATGFGQWLNPPPAEGLRMAIAALLDSGLSEQQVSILVKENPKSLVD